MYKRQYYYRVTDPVGSTEIGEFETAAELGTQNGLKFGVSGDWRGELAPYPAIVNANEANLDFFVLHGDTVYADFPSPGLPKAQAETLAEFQAKYMRKYMAIASGKILGQTCGLPHQFWP